MYSNLIILFNWFDTGLKEEEKKLITIIEIGITIKFEKEKEKMEMESVYVFTCDGAIKSLRSVNWRTELKPGPVDMLTNSINCSDQRKFRTLIGDNCTK